MINKPKHLTLPYAEQFKEPSVVAAYAHRPPIPNAVFELLLQLIVDEPRVVLDVGCGTGAVARRLAPLVEWVDAVDFSAAMIAAGRQLPEGDHPNLHWIESAVEAAPLDSTYALIVAAGSLHWMDWEVVMPRFHSLLSSRGVLAIVWQLEVPQAWSSALGKLIQRYSTNQDFQPFNLIEELTKRQLFQQQGEQHTAPILFQQSISSYIESIHSRNGFSRERMTAANAQAFDDSVIHLLSKACVDGWVRFEVVGHVVWGEPMPTTKVTNYE